MTKINKSKEQSRNRVRLFRGIQAILNNERNLDRINNQNRYNTMAKTVSSSSPPNSLSDQLKMWVLRYNLTQRAVTELLRILKSCGIKHLPIDARTLMKTPRVIHIQNTAGGKLYYNGVAKGLSAAFSKLNSNVSIQLNINADGLPLFKSSATEFWPLLAIIPGDLFECKF